MRADHPHVSRLANVFVAQMCPSFTGHPVIHTRYDDVHGGRDQSATAVVRRLPTGRRGLTSLGSGHGRVDHYPLCSA